VKKPIKMTLFTPYYRIFNPNHDRLFTKNSFIPGSMTASADRINFENPIKLSATHNKVNKVNKLVMVFADPYLDRFMERVIYQSFITLQSCKANVINQPHPTLQIPRHTLLAPGQLIG
jgi:hypothetical protein